MTGCGAKNSVIACVVLPAALIAGCGPKPAGIAPPVAPPAEFSAAGMQEAADRWWQSFGDAALNEAVERSLADNLSLRGAWFRLAQAEAAARREGAGAYPNMSLSAGAELTRQHTGNVATNGTDTEFSLGAAASYEVDLWGRVRAASDASLLDARASAEDVRTAAVTLSAQVATTWFRISRQEAETAVLRRQLRSNEEMLELVTFRFQQGQSKAEDVLRQRQAVEARRGDIARGEANRTVLCNRLAVLLGQNPGTSAFRPTPDLPDLPPMPAAGVPADLIRRRPDVRKAYFEVMAADRRTAAAIADRFPRITLSAGANTSAESVTDLFSNWLASLAANVAMPLVDGGRRKAEVERTRAATSASLTAYGQTVLDALAEVENAIATERRQQEYVTSLRQQLSLAAEVINRARDNYLQGVTEYTRVLEAQQTHQALEISYLGAQLALIENRIALYRALSGGWELTRPGPSTGSR
ncbi:MAG TPA: TolC family protein [Candidatus Latescibacteria bacterium]|nr:TolC family protein [Candidatus Latescibacterota bacterium]HPK74700.1 TolC family protein [Candidatus Latescibacterota bacterium]